MSTRMNYASDVLRGLGIAHPIAYVGSRRALCAVMVAESGVEACDGVWGAAYNPLNTTLPESGSTSYNSSNVQNYTTYEQGVDAVCETLLLTGNGQTYRALVDCLLSPFLHAKDVLIVWDKTPWGTHEPLLGQALARYQADRTLYNRLGVG